MDGRGFSISDGDKKTSEAQLAVRREPDGQPQPRLKKVNGAGLVSAVAFPVHLPGELEGLMAPLSEAKVNQLVECAFSDIQEIKRTSKDLDELEQKMGALLYRLASKEDINYALVVDKLLMKHWTQKTDDGAVPYNAHMKAHVDAIDTLFEGMMRELKTRFRSGRKIRILDVSCGTGEVLKRFLDRMSPDVLQKVQIVANDASPAAIEVCRETLKGYEGKVKKLRFTNQDMSKGLPEGKYHVILESQSMEFIGDDRIIKAKRLGRTIRQDEEEYDKGAKRDLVSLMFNSLVPERGLMLMVQEDPMMLSKPARDSDGVITKMLFDEIFRPIRKEELINDVLKAIPGVKFVCDLQTPIDRHHDMYLVASSRSKKKDARVGTYHASRMSQLPPTGDRVKSRDFDVHERNIEQAMVAIYPILAERLRKIEGESEELRPITGTRLVIDSKRWDEEASKPHFWKKNGTNDLVIVSGLIHNLGIESYQRLIDNLNSSGKAKAGTVLLFIDEWPAPAILVDNHVGNGDARKYVFRRPDHTFLASFRSGNKYGYQYVKRDPLKLSAGSSGASNEDRVEEDEAGTPAGVISLQSLRSED